MQFLNFKFRTGIAAREGCNLKKQREQLLLFDVGNATLKQNSMFEKEFILLYLDCVNVVVCSWYSGRRFTSDDMIQPCADNDSFLFDDHLKSPTKTKEDNEMKKILTEPVISRKRWKSLCKVWVMVTIYIINTALIIFGKLIFHGMISLLQLLSKD